MAKRYWLCAGCGTRNERIKQKCGCGRKRPAARGPKHAKTLAGDTYPHYLEVAQMLHGVTDESCNVWGCGKPRSQHRRHDRDHDHRTGNPRGLLCVRHNQMLDSRTSATELRALADYLDRAAKYPDVFKEAA